MPTESNWIDGIPIVGYVKALIYCNRCELELASDAFKGTSHNTGAACFGVFGARLAGSSGGVAGSITGAFVGGVIGGVFVDALINRFSSDNYGYAVYENKVCNRKMGVDDWLDLQLLILKDGIIGLTASKAYAIAMPFLSLYYTENHDEIDLNSLVTGKEKAFDIYLDFYAISCDREPGLTEIIPIFGELNAFKRRFGSRRNMTKKCKWVAHYASVTCFGVLGGMAGGIKGSIAGGILGGFVVDGKISEVTSTSYGYASYFEKYRNGSLDDDKRIDLFLLALMDTFTILRSLIEYDLIRRRMRLTSNKDHESKINPIGLFEEKGRDVPGLRYGVLIKKDMSVSIYHIQNPEAGFGREIKCLKDVCEKPKVRKDDSKLKYVGNIQKGCRYSIKIPLDDSKFRYEGFIQNGCRYSIKIPLGMIKRTIRRLLKIIKRNFIESQVEPQFVDNLLQLERGDHIVYERCYQMMLHLYDHHAIVGEVFPEKFKYRVYEQTPVDMNDRKFWIKEKEKPFETKSFYIKDHSNTGISKEKRREISHYICHHATPAAFNKSYDFFFNNCEHFASFCSTGILESEQVQDFVAGIVHLCIIGGLNLLGYTLMISQYAIGFCLIDANFLQQ